uniref:Uncharacterized protein n=1 Tax=Romanomermis culicivorax TaxID=13658 RepID=A0A915INK8_ROMCU
MVSSQYVDRPNIVSQNLAVKFAVKDSTGAYHIGIVPAAWSTADDQIFLILVDHPVDHVNHKVFTYAGLRIIFTVGLTTEPQPREPAHGWRPCQTVFEAVGQICSQNRNRS